MKMQVEPPDPDDNDNELVEIEDGSSATKKSKIVVVPHKKSKIIRSNKQALSEIARGINESVFSIWKFFATATIFLVDGRIRQ